MHFSTMIMYFVYHFQMMVLTLYWQLAINEKEQLFTCHNYHHIRWNTTISNKSINITKVNIVWTVQIPKPPFCIDALKRAMPIYWKIFLAALLWRRITAAKRQWTLHFNKRATKSVCRLPHVLKHQIIIRTMRWLGLYQTNTIKISWCYWMYFSKHYGQNQYKWIRTFWIT